MATSQQALSDLICKLLHALSRMERIGKAETTLTIPQCHTLELVAQLQPVSVTELSTGLGIAPSTTTRIVDILVRDGLVARTHGVKDRRTILLTLTKKGTLKVQELNLCSLNCCKTISCFIPRQKQPLVISALSTLEQALTRMAEQKNSIAIKE